MAQYLDIKGLSKYDELIKALINKADSELGDRIDAVVEENNSSLAEIISIIGEVSDGKTLSGLISDLNREDENIRKLIGEIAGVDSDAADNIASMSEIVEQIKNLQQIIGQKYSDGSDAETIVDRIEDLERDGEIYKPSQSLVDVTDLSSIAHGGLESKTAAWFKEKGYTYSQMFDEILFPTILPTMTEPSLNWKDYSTPYDKMVGDDITDLVLTNDNIKDYITVDLGSWSLSTNEGISASKSCGPIKVNKIGEYIDNGDGTYFMGTSTIEYQAFAKFEEGEDPKDNKGNICTDKGYFSNSNVYSTTACIYPYYNFYATTNQSEPGELVLQPIIRNAGIDTVTTQVSITLSPHTSTTPWKLKLPKELQTLWVLNTSNGKYEEIEMSGDAPRMWKHEQEKETENGIKYHIYTYIGSDNNSTNIQIKF